MDLATRNYVSIPFKSDVLQHNVNMTIHVVTTSEMSLVTVRVHVVMNYYPNSHTYIVSMQLIGIDYPYRLRGAFPVQKGAPTHNARPNFYRGLNFYPKATFYCRIYM